MAFRRIEYDLMLMCPSQQTEDDFIAALNQLLSTAGWNIENSPNVFTKDFPINTLDSTIRKEFSDIVDLCYIPNSNLVINVTYYENLMIWM